MCKVSLYLCIVAVFIVTTVVTTLYLSTGVSALVPWGKSNIIQVDSQSRVDPSHNTCTMEDFTAYDYVGASTALISDYRACVTKAKDFSFTFYADRWGRYRWAVSLPNSDHYVPVDNIDYTTKMTVGSGSNALYFSSHTSGSVYATLSSFMDGTKAFEPSITVQGGTIVAYRLKVENAIKWFSHNLEGPERYLAIHSYAVSSNGRYVLGWVEYSGYVRLDTTDGELVGLGRYPGSWQGGVIANPYAAAITDDGKYAFLTQGPTVIDVDRCGYAVTIKSMYDGIAFDQSRPKCELHNYTQDVELAAGYNGYADYYRWVNDGSGLEFVYSSPPYKYPMSTNLITISSNKSESGLNYLALGDSFTSGEGDTDSLADGSSFYLPGTEQSGGCHVSSRSYPFVLAGLRESSADKVKNVACSGAQLAKDYYGDSTHYSGQSDRIKDKSEVEKTEIRQAALESFSPGILKQIDFVRKAQPKYVTITGGGNDAGFGPILKECAQSVGVTCSYATRGSDMMVVLGKSIQQQFSSMQNVIAAVKEVSPNTVVYVVGYPSFVASEARSCGGRAGALNQRERTVINSGVAYLNDVLKAAAESKGVHYVDVENSLAGGRLCEQQAYVTSVIDAFFDEDMRQAFHPNATGHQKMAESLLELNVLGESENPEALQAVAPGVPAEFGSSGDVKVQRMTNIVKEILKIRNKTMFKVDKGMFKAFTKVSISIHSKTKKLGEYKVAADGSLNAERNLPNDIPTGYHTVLLKGVAADGAPLWLFQSVYIEGEEPDVDKDGVPNGDDKCQFRPQRFDEDNQRFVCADKPRNHHKKEDKR